MRDLTKEEVLNIVSDKVADYSKEIYMFVTLDGEQPVVMYTSLFRGIPSKHYLGLELKLKYSGGLYVYRPESKQFDITQHEWSDEFTYFDFDLHKDRGGIIIDGEVNRGDIIAIAKHLELTAEDLG